MSTTTKRVCISRLHAGQLQVRGAPGTFVESTLSTMLSCFAGIPLVDAWFVQSGRQRLIVRWMPLTSAICFVQLLLKRRVRMSRAQLAAPRSCGRLATEADSFLAVQTPRIVDSPGLGPRFGLRQISWWPLNQLADLGFPLAALCAKCRFTAFRMLSAMVPFPRLRQNPKVFPDSRARSRRR